MHRTLRPSSLFPLHPGLFLYEKLTKCTFGFLGSYSGFMYWLLFGKTLVSFELLEMLVGSEVHIMSRF